jgi:hypothetical protein
VKREVSPDAWRALAEALVVEQAVLRAVAEVESSGSGFLAPPSEQPKVLFEGHAFHRLTQGRFDASHPTVSYPKWSKAHYAASASAEWKRLDRACELDRTAALQSASWGAFQIMGFNYGLCGFSDVEAFVAAQKTCADEQLESFARFIARDLFLSALRARKWAAFAAAYNGPAYAKNHYDKKLAAAYVRFKNGHGVTGAARGATTRNGRGSTARALPTPGRPDFAFTPSARRQPFRRTVKADPIDLRDWLYHPTVSIAPPAFVMPHNPRPTKNQANTSACTGFSLATVIEYLLDRGRRAVEPISGFMLYSMARRYDEWAENDERDEGSSLRGALKGWSRHGASAGRLWTKMPMPAATNHPTTDWWLDSVKRPLGAYYRLQPETLSDVHLALVEAGVVYASALTHAGWDALHGETVLPPPVTPDDLPLIECRAGLQDGGHAFAIVGYTEKGLIIQNSWGPKWGRGGFAILSYSDWRMNVMDCWVVQLGVVTTEHERVAAASTLRVDAPTGRAMLSTIRSLAAHEISPFVVDMQNEGRLSDRGQFRTNLDDLKLLLDFHLPEACARWQITRDDTVDVALYAHGGLVDEKDAAACARQWIPLLYSNRVFPIFLMWETDGLSTVFNLVEDTIKGEDAKLGADWLERFRTTFSDWKNERIEGLTRVPGGALWREMKENAEDISSTSVSGVVQLFNLFKQNARRAKLPSIRLHLVGHSAGTIVHTHLAARALRSGFTIGSMSLLAPAVRVDDFESTIGASIPKRGIRVLLAHLTDAAERDDPSCKPYGHSLLYLVSRAFEDRTDMAVLGMEKHLVPALVAYDWGAHVVRLASPGAAFRPGDQLTVATTHVGLDDDRAVQEAVIRHIKGPGFNDTVVRLIL